jgi:cation diffusion facilitator family transporter
MGIGHQHGGHGHTHGGVDSSLIQNREATKVLLISLVGLLITSIIQTVIFSFSGSTALLADLIHNFGDALTSIPLYIAFMLSRRKPTKRFTYGLNRSEDIAGLIIVVVIAISALVAGYVSIHRLIQGTEMNHLWATAAAAIIGFIGNEVIAIYRIGMGKRMASAALIADGQHARVDGYTSLAVLIGVIGTWMGYPVIDALVGLGITFMIILIVKDSAKAVFTRLLDGIEPETIDKIQASVNDVKGVEKVSEVKARWFGHEIITDISITVESDLTVKQGHDIAKNVIHRLQHDIEHLALVQVHIDPEEESGAAFHAHESFHEARHEQNHHNGHSDHHEHSHHHGHSHDHTGGHTNPTSGTYPFEWSGVYELSVGDYEFILKAGPDPAMLISLLSISAFTQDALEAAKLDAIEVFKGTVHSLPNGGVLQPSRDLIQLLLEGAVTFLVRITKPGAYVLFTEHHPDEFSATLCRNGSIMPLSLQQAFPSAHTHEHK